MDRLDNKLALIRTEKCDKYDYLISAFCGLTAGLIDVFFVGAPGGGKLSVAADKVADNFVINAAQLFWKFDTRDCRRKSCPESLTQCISYLEQAFPVPYDARYAKDLDVSNSELSGMTPKNHHLLSLAHSPDIVGLIFSIIDQFTNTASFIDKGQIIHVALLKNSKAIPYLTGTNFHSKLFCGFVNWIGHIISDLVGSSSTRTPKKTGRGMGVPMPFYNLLLLADFGNFDGESFSKIAIEVFTQGYDLRHCAAMAIPVMINDMMVKVLWALKRRIYHKCAWRDCIPSNIHSSLRWMLIVSNSALCLVDGIDAMIKSGGNIVIFVLNLNIIAWFKLILMILKEIMIRYSFTYDDLKLQFQKINAALDDYLQRLKSVDYAKYEQELGEIREIYDVLMDEYSNTDIIYKYFQSHNVIIQFNSFEEFDLKMQDKNFVLEI